MEQIKAEVHDTSRTGGSSERLQLVTFDVAGEEYAVDILSVREINRMTELTRVPQSPDEVEGVINLRGTIIPVLNLGRRFGIPESERNEQTRIIVVEVSGRVIGFIVDCVHEVLWVSRSIVEPAPAMACPLDSAFIAGVAKLDDRLLILLDLERLFDGGVLAVAEESNATVTEGA